MRDITDFSAKDSKAYKESVSLYEEAFGAANSDLLNFDEARRCQEEIPTTFRHKTHNRADFLDEAAVARRKISEKTNAVEELLEANQDLLKEELSYGATPEELEAEVRGDFGRQILEICKEHNITRSAIWDALDILKAILGDEPEVEQALESWGGNSTAEEEEDVDTEETDDESEDMEESVENFPKTISEMTIALRKKIAEKKIREKAGLRK